MPYSPGRINHELAENDGALSLDCHECGTASFATVSEYLSDQTDTHHALYVSQKRVPEPEGRSEERLITVIAQALANEDNLGRFHFECSECDSMNRAKGVTIGPFENGDRAVYVRGEPPFPGGNRVQLRTVPETFVCTACGHEDDPASVRETGPEAPEIGWEYYECPACQNRTGNIPVVV